MRKLLVIAFLFSISSGFGPAIAFADKAQDIEDATARAEEIFQLADQGKFNAMYDLIHPDAHEIVPRTVAVNTFRELYALADAGRIDAGRRRPASPRRAWGRGAPRGSPRSVGH